MGNVIQERFADAIQYDAMMSKIFPGYEQLTLVILSYLRTRLGPRARVLDLGCGTGTTLIAFATHQPQWSLVGVDPAESMVSLAREKASALGIGERLELVTGTVEVLPDEPAFDAAVSVLVEHLQPDDGAKLRLLEGISQRLAPGGSFVLAGLNGDLGTPAAQRALDAWIQFAALQGLPEEAQKGVRYKATTEDSLVPEARIRELLAQASFVDVERIYQAQLLGGWIAQKA